MGIDGLERLEAWKKSESFAVRIYHEVLPLLLQKRNGGWTSRCGVRRRASRQILPRGMVVIITKKIYASATWDVARWKSFSAICFWLTTSATYLPGYMHNWPSKGTNWSASSTGISPTSSAAGREQMNRVEQPRSRKHIRNIPLPKMIHQNPNNDGRYVTLLCSLFSGLSPQLLD